MYTVYVSSIAYYCSMVRLMRFLNLQERVVVSSRKRPIKGRQTSDIDAIESN